MRKAKMNIKDIISEIASLKGENVNMRVNKGRNKYEKYIGIVKGVYPSIFTVDVIDPKYIGMISYSYNDVLCGDVALKIIKHENKNF